jgi:hypothetical protein
MKARFRLGASVPTGNGGGAGAGLGWGALRLAGRAARTGAMGLGAGFAPAIPTGVIGETLGKFSAAGLTPREVKDPALFAAGLEPLVLTVEPVLWSRSMRVLLLICRLGSITQKPPVAYACKYNELLMVCASKTASGFSWVATIFYLEFLEMAVIFTWE